jgi:hypothetical protein
MNLNGMDYSGWVQHMDPIIIYFIIYMVGCYHSVHSVDSVYSVDFTSISSIQWHGVQPSHFRFGREPFTPIVSPPDEIHRLTEQRVIPEHISNSVPPS